MTPKQRLRARQRLIKAGLPIPPELEVRGKGWKPGRLRGTKPRAIPVQKPNMDGSAKYKARQTFIYLGLPIPEWCAAKSYRESTVKNRTGMSMQEYAKADAPPWAKFKAVDDCGDAWFFEADPIPNNGGWSSLGRISFLGEVICPNWVKSKRAI